MKEYTILSLFDGASTLQLAMKNIGIPVKKYYASEIKKAAIKLSLHHFPKTIHLGDIENWKKWNINWENIDLIGSGSPCQDLSIAGNRKGIHGDKSKLFFVFVDILNHIKKLNPNVLFIQENVKLAPIKDIRIISENLDIYPICIDSKLFLPQQRKRLYWSNIKTKKDLFGYKYTYFDLPKKRKNIFLQDILTEGYSIQDISPTLTENYVRANNYKNIDKLKYRFLKKSIPFIIQLNKSEESNGRQPYFQNRVYSDKGISPALCARFKIIKDNNVRILNKVELARLQGFPDDYFSILNIKETGSLAGDAWSVPVIEHILKHLI